MSAQPIDRGALLKQCEARGLTFPLTLLDEEAFEHNRRLLFSYFPHSSDIRMRIATKSLRCGALLKRLLDADPERRVISGLMCYRIAEAEFLVGKYSADDVLIAYPIASSGEAARLAKLQAKVGPDGSASIVVDNRHHVELLAHQARAVGTEIPLVIDLNLAFRPLGVRGPQLGARRSPLSSASEVLALAEHIRALEGARVHGVMGYEAHHAAVPDRPHEKIFKRISLPPIEHLRAAVGEALERAGFGTLPLLNGGGSGSYLTTSASRWVNEVAVGSAFYKTALFDHHKQLEDFRPSLFFVLQVVRVPGPGWATAFGGGYYASAGGMPPVMHDPKGLKITGQEEFGEVQTPVRDPEGQLALGDLIVCRPSKAGEPLERFNEIFPFENGRLGGPLKTYRGDGKNFG